MSPILEKLAAQYEDQIDLVKVDADLDVNEDLLRQYDVKSLPTLVLLDSNGKVVGKIIGAQSYGSLRDWIEAKIK
jgi:thioredoxin-like negative regulator of GroEL